MNRVALSFQSKDRMELTQRSLPILLDGARKQQFDLFVCDGSTTEANEEALFKLAYPTATIASNVRGGADAAIVYALTMMLNRKENYEYVGLVENDVLLHSDWFAPTFTLFEQGRQHGLHVGAVSARSYADRILIQRDGYAIMHNLGAGMVIFTREAARIVLDHYRTGWTLSNRSVFSILSGIDIGKYWAFKGGEHWLTADWGFDKNLAAQGYVSLALTPAKCEMIGQNPPLADQGLILVYKEIDEFRNDMAFEQFERYTNRIQQFDCTLPDQRIHRDRDGELIFTHQLGFHESGDWRLKWVQGFGPFAWQAEAGAEIGFMAVGSVNFLLQGGEHGSQFKVVDGFSGFETTPTYAAGILGACFVPGGFVSRMIFLTSLTPGGLFCGIQTPQPQPWNPSYHFDHSCLPGIGENK